MKLLPIVLIVGGALTAALSVAQLIHRNGNSPRAFGTALTTEMKQTLRGADTGGGGVKRCLAPGTKFGCPGKPCGVTGATCVICTNAATPLNEECSTAGTGVICNSLTIDDCANFTPPIMGTKGTCTAAGCTPYNPAVIVSCGVYATCP